jgi:hypothetical protein
MTRALYIAPDGKARAIELGVGWFPAAPSDLAGVPVPCAVVIGASGVQTFPEPLTVSAVRAAIAASVAVEAAAAAAEAVLTANGETLRGRAKTALATNATFLAITSPTTAQVREQARALTRQVDALIRLTVNALDSISDA